MLHSITSDKLVQSTYHWHSHGVSSVVFNSDGTYMMSGGEEAVLVIWQLETGNKRFLPRLGTLPSPLFCTANFLAVSSRCSQLGPFFLASGSPIIGLGISIRDTHYATVHEDNSVQVIDALSLKIIGQIRGLRRDNTKTGRPDGRCGLLVEPTTGHVVLNGSLGALQFFNLDRDSVVKEQQGACTSTPVPFHPAGPSGSSTRHHCVGVCAMTILHLPSMTGSLLRAIKYDYQVLPSVSLHLPALL
jgi:NET1-associated nuclear protein 1 (U3 small nucleolar RNA-associated protein 17)